MTTINLINNTETFTLNGIVYTHHTETGRFSKTENGKTKRIGVTEYQVAEAEADELDRKAAELDAAAENPEVTLEQFVELVQEAEDSANTEAGEIELIRQTADRVVKESAIRAKAADQMGAEQESQMFWGDWNRAMAVLNRCETGDITDDDRRFAKAFGANIEVPEKAEQPKAKKERKPRKSKDIAYEGHGVTLTAKQVDFIRHLPDTYFWERGLDSQIWCDVLAEEIRGQFAGKPMTTGAMLSTICEKGLGDRCKDRINGRKCTSFALTELGKIVAAELGLH